MWCECEISFQFERIFHSPQMDSFLLTTQFVHCLISSSWWWANSSHFGLQDEQGETGQARTGNFDPSWNRSTQFQVRARLTWRPPPFRWFPTVMAAAFQFDPARFDPPLLYSGVICYTVRIISVTATRRIRFVFWCGATSVLFVVILAYRLRFKWKCGVFKMRMRMRLRI